MFDTLLLSNIVCQAVYLQGLNGMRDKQLDKLIKLLRESNIWCVNLGESHQISSEGWHTFSNALPTTIVTHLYVSEHFLPPNLKNAMRSHIRDNRKKHMLHCSPSNLKVINLCQLLWWNPINSNYLKQKEKKRVLLLGMWDSNDPTPGIGQGPRDTIRCNSLKEMGYQVETMDDKHDSNGPVHCSANFCDWRRMMQSMKNVWRPILCRYDCIILDYFFSPNGYANARWKDSFFNQTLMNFGELNILRPDGKIFLPNKEYVISQINAVPSLRDIYEINIVASNENPLYVATDTAYELLIQCENQLVNQNSHADNFVCLQRKVK